MTEKRGEPFEVRVDTGSVWTPGVMQPIPNGRYLMIRMLEGESTYLFTEAGMTTSEGHREWCDFDYDPMSAIALEPPEVWRVCTCERREGQRRKRFATLRELLENVDHIDSGRRTTDRRRETT